MLETYVAVRIRELLKKYQTSDICMFLKGPQHGTKLALIWSQFGPNLVPTWPELSLCPMPMPCVLRICSDQAKLRLGQYLSENFGINQIIPDQTESDQTSKI